MAQTITDSFIDVMWKFSNRDFPQEIIDECKVCLLDYMACVNLGARMLRSEYKSYVNAFGRNEGNSTIIGEKKKTNASCAAMTNGINAHYSELDDGHRFAMLHPGVPVISAILAVVQDRHCNAEQFIRGLITGYEATIRLAGAIQPGHKLRGYHATGTCGTIGAAIGVIAMLGYPKRLWRTAISAAATSASGLLQVIDDGSELKPFNAGRAAASAVEAAYFATTGMNGPSDVLGGDRGFFVTVTDRADCDYLLNEYKGYAIKGIYRKPYAACRHCHAPIEATLNLCKENKIQIKDIKQISVSTYDLAVKGHDHAKIKGIASAKMSIPYAVAAAARFGSVNFQQYSEECIRDNELVNLLGRVSVLEDTELSKLVPKKRPAIVSIETDAGSFTKRVDYPLGEPENPMNYEMMKEKYLSMMEAAGRSQAETNDILNYIEHFEMKFDTLLTAM